ncbi:hypothetical protein PHISP_01729 [Aspergillus sp. HF37]|nr:hypothetical protein PHISP_01729 [Aspergillus sp. HF37]
MAAQQLSPRFYARRMLAYSYPPATTKPVSLDSLDELASSRPIPLSALSSRANSRNKRSKIWKPLQLDDDDHAKDRMSSTSIFDTSKYDPRSQPPVPHQSSGDDSSLGNYQGGYAQSRLQPLEQDSEDIDDSAGQPWIKPANTNVQRNPLSYSTSYDYLAQASQHHGYISEAPFVETDNCVHLESPAWFGNGRQMQYGRSSGGNQPQYRLLFPGEKPPVPEPLLRSYEAETSNPYTSYTEPSQQMQQHNQVNTNRPVSTLRYPLQESQHAQNDDYRRSESEEMHPNVCRAALSGAAVSTDRASQVQMSNPSLAQTSNAVYPTKTAQATLHPDPNDTSRNPKANDSKEEMAAYLKRVVQASEMNTKTTSPSDPFLDADILLREEYQGPNLTASSTKQSLDAKPDERTRVSEEISSITRKLDAANESFKLLCAASIPETQGSGMYREDEIGSLMRKSETLASKAASKILRPPPGLASHAAAKETERPSFGKLSKAESAVMEESNRWFHTDSRGERHIREQATEIAQAHAEDCKKLKGATNAATAKQTTLLLGNVIANLQSYVSDDRKKQAQNFANFESVPDQYCEASHSGRRSYFDCDPSVGHERVAADRSFPALGDVPEKTLVLSRLHRSPMSEAWDALGRGF